MRIKAKYFYPDHTGFNSPPESIINISYIDLAYWFDSAIIPENEIYFDGDRYQSINYAHYKRNYFICG